MSEFKGTKGVWTLLEGYNSCGVSIGNKNTMVFSNGDSEELANALLISKSPEMLNKLNQCLQAIESQSCIEDERGVVYRCEIGISFINSIKKLIKEATEL